MGRWINELNYFKYRLKYRFGKRVPLKYPADVSLELASICNQFCSYCYHHEKQTPFQKGFMSFDLAKKIIHESALYGVNSLKFNWKGESTLHPGFRELTTYAKSLAYGSVFIDRLTNSNFKFRTDRDDIFEGLCNQTKVKVSFDSFKKEIFESQRQGGDWDLTYLNIGKFYRYPKRNKTKTKLIIQAVRTKQNQDEDIMAEVKRRWPEAMVSIRDMVSGRLDKNLENLETRKRDPSERQSCLQAHVRLIFNHEGKAFPCCPDIKEQLCLGDIRENSLHEIFNGAKAIALRKSLKNKTAFNVDPCLNCSSFETYKGFKPAWDS